MKKNVEFYRELLTARTDLLNEKAAAAFLGVSPGTLSVWRSTGRYKLPFLKVGRNVRYRFSDLEEWLSNCVRDNGTTV